MKLWQAFLVIVLFGAGAYVVVGELRYDRLVEEAEAKADSVRVYRARVDSLTEVAVRQAGQVVRLEAKVTADSIRFARERFELAREVRELRAEQDEIELELRASLDERQAELLDSLTTSWADERRALHEDRAILEERLAGVEVLRRAQAEALESTRVALDSCQCALDAAEEAIRTYAEATESRTVFGRAWDAITSKTGLVVVGGILAAWGSYELVTGADSSHQ